MRNLTLLAAFALAVGCGAEPDPPPPDRLAFHGLPVAGDLAYAKGEGFTRCTSLRRNLRCRREGITFFDEGPFHGAVDAVGPTGGGGFTQLTLWSEASQNKAIRIGKQLEVQGWTACRTGEEDRGDQAIWRKEGSPVRISIDITYWGNRRVRVLPEQGQATGRCW